MENCLEDCITCSRETKYKCILCLLPICNVCSVAQLDDDTQGWIAGKRVAYCGDCNEQRNKCDSPHNTSKDSSSSTHVEDTEEPCCSKVYFHNEEPETSDDEPDKEVSDTVPKQKKKPGRKARWSDHLVNDMVDIIVNNDYYKKKLIFVNTKNQKNAEIYGRILEELRARASARGEVVCFTAVQMRTKFKKLISECKRAALTIKSATGIQRFQEDKGFGPWFDQLYPLVKTRDSCNPELAIEPSNEWDGQISLTSSSETTESDVAGNLFVPLKIKKAKKENQLSEVVGMLKSFVEKDPMKDFIAFAKEDAEKSRQQELRMMELLMTNQSTNNNHPPQFQNHSVQPQANLNGNQMHWQTWQPNNTTISQQYTEKNGQSYFQL